MCIFTDAGTCSQGTPSDLNERTDYTAHAYANLASGDLNGDGLLDVIAGRFEVIGGFDVFLGLPDGGIGEPRHYDGASEWNGQAGGGVIALADLNLDGTVDVMVSNGSSVDVFLNDGTGGLAAPLRIPTTRPPTSIGIGDFNNDQIPDLALTERDSVGVGAELLLGLGDGHFAPPMALSGAGGVWGGLVVADLNRDGLPDLAMNSPSATSLNVFLNDGDGGFAITSYPTALGGQIATLPNAQGSLDLVLTNQNGRIQVLHNSGSGAFAIGDQYERPTDGMWLVVGDFNGDCVPDIASSAFVNCDQASPVLTVLYGDGVGGFGSPVSLQPAGIAPAGVALIGPVGSPRALAVGDACGSGLAVYGDPSKH